MDQLKVADAREVVAALAKEGVPAGPVFWRQCYVERVFQEHNGFGKLRYAFRDPAACKDAGQYGEVSCPNVEWLEEQTVFVPTIRSTRPSTWTCSPPPSRRSSRRATVEHDRRTGNECAREIALMALQRPDGLWYTAVHLTDYFAAEAGGPDR